jgi:hypothetical protein
MAALEAKTVLALVLRDYELVRPANTPVMQARFGTTRAKGGIWVEVRPRATSHATSGPGDVSASP